MKAGVVITLAALVLTALAQPRKELEEEVNVENWMKKLSGLAKSQDEGKMPSLLADEQGLPGAGTDEELNAEEQDVQSVALTQDEKNTMKDIELQIQGLDDSAKAQGYCYWYKYYYRLYCRWRGYYYNLLKHYKTYRHLYLTYRKLYHHCRRRG